MLGIFAFLVFILSFNVVYLVTTGKTLLSQQNIRDYSKVSASSKVTETIQASRGTIYTSDNEIVAADVKKYNIYAVLSDTRKSMLLIRRKQQRYLLKILIYLMKLF